MQTDFSRPCVFPGIFAFFLAFVYQYFISPPRERPRASNAPAHRELSNRSLSDLAEPQRGRDAVARRDTHPGLLGCALQR